MATEGRLWRAIQALSSWDAVPVEGEHDHTPNVSGEWEERAAILEHEAGFSREAAERLASEQVVAGQATGPASPDAMGVS